MRKNIQKKGKLEKFYKNKNVLIPGGAGFIGSNLTKKLVQLGAKCTVVDPFYKFCGANRFNLKSVRKKIKLRRIPIENFVLNEKLSKFKIIFNCVGLTNHHIGFSMTDLDYGINCHSGLKILNSIKEQGAKCRLISIGTRSQYGRTERTKIKESHPLNPLDIQSVHKAALEHFHNIYAVNYDLDLIFVRLTNVYGAGQRLNGDGIGAIGEILKNSLIGKPVVIYGNLDRIKDVLFIDDVVDSLLLLGMRKEKKYTVYNLGGQQHKLSEIIKIVKKRFKNLKVILRPFPDSIRRIDAGDVVLDIRKITKDTFWKPKISLRKGIDLTLDFYLRHKREYF